MTVDKVMALVARSLRSRTMMANSLCILAEESQDGNQARTVVTIRTLRGVLADISLIIDGDVSCLPIADLRNAQELLCGMEARIAAMEKVMGSETVH